MMKKLRIFAFLWQMIYVSSTEIQSFGLTNHTAVKIQLRDDVKKTSNEIITQAGVGRIIGLGCLYYGSSDRVSTTKCFWKQTSLAGVFIDRSSNRHGEVHVNSDTMERLKNFDISAGLSLSILGGMISLSGSAKYLKETRETENTVSLSYFYNYVSRSESLTQEIISKKDWPHLCKEVDKGATHVVSSITRGQKAIFTFKYTTKETSQNMEVEGKLEAALKKIPQVNFSVNASIAVTKNETIKGKDLECSFLSDMDIPQLPTNYKEAVETYKGLVDQTDENTTNVLKFDLEPINNYCTDTDAILNELSDEVMDKIKDILLNLEKLERKAVSLRASKAALYFPRSLGISVDTFVERLGTYATKWKENLSKYLPLIRRGEEEPISKLSTMINDYQTSPFADYRANVFLAYRKKELDTVAFALNDKNIRGIEIDDISADVNSCKWGASYAVRYELSILPRENIVEKYLNEANDGVKAWSETTPWYQGNGISNAGDDYGEFERLRIMKNEDIDNNKEKDDVCYYVTLSKLKDTMDDRYSRIVVSDKGDENDDVNIVILEKPSMFTVTQNSIEFEVSLNNDGFTDRINVEIKNQYDVNDKGLTRSFDISSNGKTVIKFDELPSGHEFSLKISAASKIGRTSEYYDLGTITTNSHSAPQNLRILDRTSSSFTIGWEKPSFLRHDVGINAYNIGIRESNSGKKIKDQKISVDVSEDEFRTQITGLQDFTNFDIEVFPKTNETYDEGALEIEKPKITRKGFRAEIQGYTFPNALQAPTVIEGSNHSVSLKWDPPYCNENSSCNSDSRFLSYIIKYDRVDPNTAQPLTLGNEVTAHSEKTEIVLKDLASGGTYRIQVAVTTTVGTNSYSAATLFTTDMNESELDKFRDSLNMESIEKNIKELDEFRDSLNIASIEKNIKALQEGQSNGPR